MKTKTMSGYVGAALDARPLPEPWQFLGVTSESSKNVGSSEQFGWD
jgi:hypothetical protein